MPLQLKSLYLQKHFILLKSNYLTQNKMKKIILLLVVGIALTTQTLFAQVPSYVPTNGLVGYWPFNGNANDQSGNGNNGTVNGATLTTDRLGNADSAYSFNGNSGITIPHSTSLIVGNSSTFSFWLKYNSLSNGFNLVFKKGIVGGCPDSGYYFAYDGIPGPVFKCFGYGVPGNCSGISDSSSLDNQWHNIVVVYNLQNSQIYFDGILQDGDANSNLSQAIFNTVEPLIIGYYNGPYSGTSWNGLIDDFGIWNRALTQQEITTMYNSVEVPTYSDTCNNVSGSLTQGLVGYWPFCGNANDDSGNGNNGTVNGATLTTDRFGNENSAYYFSSSGCSTRIDAQINTSSIQSGLTISLWVNKLGDGCINPRVFEFYSGSGGPTDAFMIWSNNGTTDFGSITSTNTFVSTSFIPEPNNVWFNLVYTNDGLNGKFYKNGILFHTEPSSGTVSLNGNLAIGRMNHPSFDAFNGKIDDFGIWNRALTQEEITNLYNVNQCITNITVTDTLIINVGQLSFNDPVTWANNITIAPNPASTEVNINFNNITNLNGGTLKIINSLGQEVATTPITTSGTNSTMQLATWGGTGMYFVQIINPQGQIIDIKKIILQ